MKIKKIKKVIAFSMAILFSATFNSCEEDLELINPNQPTPDSFWMTADDAEGGLVSVYAGLPTIGMFGRMMTGIHLIHRSDIANTFPQAFVNDAGTFSVTPDNPRLNELWTGIYSIISPANQVIARVPDIEMDAGRKAEILAEAHFVRGFIYFYIVNLFGEAPMPLSEALGLEDLFLPKSSETELWATVESDLRMAQNGLPQTPPRGEVGRATWGAVTAMLGRALLYQGKWGDAATEFKKIIDSGLYTLTADYNENFTETGVNNVESVFEIQLDGNPNGGWGPGPGGDNWRGQAWEPDIAPRGYTSQQSMSVNQWVLDLFLAQTTNGGLEDPRAAHTLIWDYPGAMVYQDAFADAFTGDDLTKVWVRKYLNFENEGSLSPGSWSGDTNNFRIARLADILLMYSEAENEVSGGSASALDALNQVRARVDMPAYAGLDQSALRDAIRDERVRELAIEGHRFFDLKRWGILSERFGTGSEFKSNSGAVYSDKFEFLPLPRRDVDSNPNLDQNPLYN
ncbi:RagB/SusD family nutrient uptake outer membrane protein [Flagellimonas onchidii]|uniref:RagB/SusD family nutrient uptake outer membrane protein n=1 Tax=Flagellimonas onchidii TaxID=2562684 RepID=UPI00145626CC|nr:RagB/SusD family nutrient uptake outer membrane protein [Allomuricauda onchidii]